MELTPFEEEILDSVLWQLEGFRQGKVSERATKRILRATLRRVKPRLGARSVRVKSNTSFEVDHAVPVNVIADMIIDHGRLTRQSLEKLISKYLIAVELTESEHKEQLRKYNLQSRMPDGWNKGCPYARYKAASIKIDLIGNECQQPCSERCEAF